jgi:hypothetical protein
VLAVDAMMASPDEHTVCRINHAFADAAVQATGALLAAYPSAGTDGEQEVDGPAYYDPEDDDPEDDDDRDTEDDLARASARLLHAVLGSSTSFSIIHRTPSGILVIERP